MKPLLLFDIDHTLFDTAGFSKLYRRKFTHYLGVPPEKLDKIRSDYHYSLQKHTDYVPEEYIKHLINSLHKNKQQDLYRKLHNLFYAAENFSQSLFPETLSVLTDLKKRHTLGIFSEGHPAYQKTKLVKSSLYDLFDPKFIYIFHRKTAAASLSALPDGSAVIDDDPEVIQELVTQTIKPLSPVWLNRLNHDKHPHARTVHSLADLV